MSFVEGKFVTAMCSSCNQKALVRKSRTNSCVCFFYTILQTEVLVKAFLVYTFPYFSTKIAPCNLVCTKKGFSINILFFETKALNSPSDFMSHITLVEYVVSLTFKSYGSIGFGGMCLIKR